jgi:hypothetical protein
MKTAAAARAAQRPARGEASLNIGDTVLLRNRCLGRNKIQDRWRANRHRVTSQPCAQVVTVAPFTGGPAVTVSRRDVLPVEANPATEPTPVAAAAETPAEPQLRWLESDDEDKWFIRPVPLTPGPIIQLPPAPAAAVPQGGPDPPPQPPPQADNQPSGTLPPLPPRPRRKLDATPPQLPPRRAPPVPAKQAGATPIPPRRSQRRTAGQHTNPRNLPRTTVTPAKPAARRLWVL